MEETSFSKLSDDVTLIIFSQLEDDPRNWARLSCVCTRFHSLITSICCKSKCISSFPSLSNDLVSLNDDWASLYKLAVCCPGLRHSGVFLDSSDFGLQRELGPTEDFMYLQSDNMTSSSSSSWISTPPPPPATKTITTLDEVVHNNNNDNNNHEFEGWSLYDDLYFDTVYDNSETSTPVEMTTGVETLDSKFLDTNRESEAEAKRRKVVIINDNNSVNNNSNVSRPRRSHLASAGCSLSREQGNKLLASRFRDDCLYISNWPGCVHIEDKRKYMLFRGVFKNFKRTRVWRTINDGNRSKVDLNCAFCSCKETWDMHSAFCLKRGFGFHDDGEPVVRAYVCENGHVSGAWTDVPLYT